MPDFVSITRGGCVFKYYFVPYHHMNQPTSNKSVWMVDREYELNLFGSSCSLSINVSSTFNVSIVNGEAQPVGKGISGQTTIDLYLCRFVNERQNQGTPWHGYPINHMDQNRERPSTDFYEKGPGSALCPRDLKRLKRGKPL